MTRFTPLFDGVLVKRAESEAKTKSGLFLPESAQQTSDVASVVAVGPGKLDKNNRRLPLDVKPGDRVLLAKWGGEELTLDGVKHLVVRESDILAVVLS